MQVVLEIESWPEAHYLICALGRAEWSYLHASHQTKDAELASACQRYAKFFKTAAKAVNKQAGALNK